MRNKGWQFHLQPIWEEAIRPVIRWLFEYSGSQFIVAKFVGKAPNSKEAPSGVIWLVGIYVAAFGLASQLYTYQMETERRIRAIDVSGHPSTLRDFAFGCPDEVAKSASTWPQLPVEPLFFYPLTVWESLVAGRVPVVDVSDQAIADAIADAYARIEREEIGRAFADSFIVVFPRIPVEEEVDPCNVTIYSKPRYAAQYRQLKACVLEVLTRHCEELV